VLTIPSEGVEHPGDTKGRALMRARRPDDPTLRRAGRASRSALRIVDAPFGDDIR
jgi:hypothetical protein